MTDMFKMDKLSDTAQIFGKLASIKSCDSYEDCQAQDCAGCKCGKIKLEYTDILGLKTDNRY